MRINKLMSSTTSNESASSHSDPAYAKPIQMLYDMCIALNGKVDALRTMYDELAKQHENLAKKHEDLRRAYARGDRDY